MFPLILNPLPVLVSLTAALGVLVHDTQIDNVAVTALSMSAIVSDSATNGLRSGSHHVHVDRGSFGESTRSLRTHQPATQPRNETDKKYIAQKRLMGNSFGNEYSWPSV